MIRTKLCCQLICTLTVCQPYFTHGQDSAACIWITDLKPEDMLMMISISNSDKLRDRCSLGLHIGVWFPDASKSKLLESIFKNFRLEEKLEDNYVQFYSGATTPIIRNGNSRTDTEFSIFLQSQLLKKVKNRILITAPCTDLARAIERSNDSSVFDNIDEIYWAGGFFDEPMHDSRIEDRKEEASTPNRKISVRKAVGYNWSKDIEATRSIVQLASLAFKTTIVSRESHPYSRVMNRTSFPTLIQKIGIMYEAGDQSIRQLVHHRRPDNMRNVKKPFYLNGHKRIWIRADPVVATMLFFYPKLVIDKKLVSYSLHVVRQDYFGTEAEVYGESAINDASIDEKQIDQPQTRVDRLYTQYPYQHKLVKEINKELFESTIVSLLKQ
uniref:AlNc14C211G8913 protein n=1 Tax=Albugo laibachii Nc14 TaxID=890382 RepID=F0WRA6_9STRA|nr:AlNc14C211G8913 [Albugo laibachii Nc14]|eukprot:CCA23868.1 AlNc14C211G8913 [Albugo laibachii Nc14]